MQMCDNTVNASCKTPEEIKTFTSDLSAQLWVIEAARDLRYLDANSYARN